jgi:hypothetical protein
MASDFCSFNLGEVCDAVCEYIKDPEVDLLEIIKAPDFTTGGYLLYDKEQMREIYTLLPVHCEVTELPAQNHERMEQIVRQQALRGGYRLAKILNEIFSK